MSISDWEIEVDAELVDNVYNLGLEGDELLDVEVSETIGSTGGGSAEIVDYTYISNKPQIEGVTLLGNKTLKQFGIIDLIYPVGSYYETSDSLFDPNTAWGGTWVLEEEGKVHLGAGNSKYTLGSTGGTETVTLTIQQMPSHSHSQASHQHTLGSDWSSGSGGSTSAYIHTDRRRNYTRTTDWQTPTIYANGGGQAHDNMQPYIAVNRWHRTA